MGKVKQMESADEFNKTVADNKIVAVDFTATWCGPCRMIGPKFEAMSEEDAFKNICFIKVDVDKLSDVAEKFGVAAMPTFKIVKEGNAVDEVVGASEPKLRELLQKYANC